MHNGTSNRSRISSNLVTIFESASTCKWCAPPVVGPNQSLVRKFGRTTHSYLTLRCCFQPLYLASWPYVVIHIVDIVPSMNPKQWPSGHPRARTTFAKLGKCSSLISNRMVGIACWKTWSSTTLYVSEMEGGERPNTCASSKFRSRSSSRLNKSKKASSPPKRFPLVDRKTWGMPNNPMSREIALRPNREVPCNLS